MPTSFISVPHTVKIVVQGIGPDGQQLINQFACDVGATPGDIDTSALATAVAAWYASDYATILPVAVIGLQVVASSMEEENGPQSTESLGLQAGSIFEEPLPPNCTLCLKKAGITIGRRNRGRTYVWPAPVTAKATSGGLFDPTYVGNALTVFNNLITAINAAGAGYLFGVASLTAGAFKPVDEYIAVDTAIDSQRRRLVGRGR